MRLLLALRCFFLVLFAARLPDDARPLLPAATPEPAEGPTPEALARQQEVRHDAALKELAERHAAERATAAGAAAAAVAQARRDSVGRGAVQLLAILQRDGRLVDFLQEDIAGYSDAQVGASVRDIHAGCKQALAEHVDVRPIRSEPDESRIRVDKGFDPSRIRLTGHVAGEPPFSGALKHPGWQAAKVSLPELPASYDQTVIAPAEVELA